MKFKLTLYTP